MSPSSSHGARTGRTRSRWVPALAVVAALAATASCTSTDASRAVDTSSPTTVAPTQEDVSGLVDIGDGRQIYAECRGQGSPTVVLISGKGNGAEDWSCILDPDDPAHEAPGDDVASGGDLHPSDAAVLPSVARSTRVCTYDRPDIRVEARGDHPRPQPHPVDLDVERSPRAARRDRRTGALRPRVALLRWVGRRAFRPHLPRPGRRSGDGRHRHAT